MKISLRLLSISIDLFGKVYDVIEENKLNSLEQLHFKTREIAEISRYTEMSLMKTCP